jgi:ribosome modulation factor
MKPQNMKPHTPFEQLPPLEQAWQLGYKEATSYKADINTNPYPANSEESDQWLKGFDNCMDYLYNPDNRGV